MRAELYGHPVLLSQLGQK